MKIRTMRGYTLVELSIAVAVLGLILVLLWRFGSVAYQRIAQTEAPQILTEANEALVGFVMANHRMPCPDTAGDGLEHCGGAVIGRLPIVALGLARADMQNIRYGVYRNTVNTLVNGTATPVLVNVDNASDRFTPLVTTAYSAKDPNTPYQDGSVTAAETLLGQVNSIDFCHALRLAGTNPANTSSLNIVDAGNASIKNVAYALALPGAHDADGDGNLFDGANTGALTFAAPAQPVSANYDDVVQAIDFGQLFDRMSCAGTLSAADHAHFNAATAAAIMYAEFINYNSQLEITVDLAVANELIAGAAVAQSVGDGLLATANITLSAADSLADPAKTFEVAQSIADEVLALASIAAAAAGDVIAKQVEQGAKDTVTAFAPLLDEASLLAQSILFDAKAADAAGLY